MISFLRSGRASVVWSLLVTTLLSGVASGAGGSEEIAWLVDRLRQGSPRERVAAATALSDLGLDAYSAGPALAVALRDDSEDVRYRAAEALIEIPVVSAEVLAALTESLCEPSARVRHLAAVALGIRGPGAGSAAEKLGEILAQGELPLQRAAFESLARIGPEGASELVNALPKAHSSIRQRVVPMLRNIGRPAAPALVALLLSGTERNRLGIIRAIGDLRSHGRLAVPELIAELSSVSPRVRLEAARTLGRIRRDPTRVVPALCGALEDADPRVRAEAASTLGLFREAARESVPVLIGLVADVAGPTTVRTEAARALGRIGVGGAEVSAALRDVLLRDLEATRLRVVAGEALGTIRPVQVEDLAEMLDLVADSDADDAIRSQLILALGDALADPSRTVPVLLQIARGRGPGGVSEAIDALGKFGELAGSSSQAVLECLVSRIESGDVTIRAAAVRAVASFPTYRRLVVSTLRKALWQRDREIRIAALETLGMLGEEAQSAVTDIADQLGNSSSEVASAAARCLASMGPAAAGVVPDLVEATERADVRVRRDCLLALREVGHKARPVLPLLRQYLSDPDHGVRVRALEAIVRLSEGPPEIPPRILIDALSQPEGEIQDLALEALQRLKVRHPALVDVLGSMLTNRKSERRAAAANALGKMGQDAVAVSNELAAALEDEEPLVREAAAWAFGDLGSCDETTIHLLELMSSRDGDEGCRKAARVVLETIRKEKS